MSMKDWIAKLDDFIKLNRKEILTHAGKVSHIDAQEKALCEYEKYKEKSNAELTQVERDFLDTIHRAYELLEGKPVAYKNAKKII